MSNLGAYQWITETSKKVGGPKNLMGVIAVAGAIVGVAVGVAGCKIIQKRQEKMNNKRKSIDIEKYVVNTFGISDEGIKFDVGEQFYVLATDEGAVLVEKVGDNNPYFVSEEFLKKISDY